MSALRANLAVGHSVPAIVIRIPFEGRPVIWKDCRNEAEEQRLDDWIESHHDLGELVVHACLVRAA